AQVLQSPLALPSAPAWTIIEQRVDSTQAQPELHLKASRTVPYGAPLPESYVTAETPSPELDLHFPTAVTVRTEGNRTYYEFRRTYQARRFGEYDITESPWLWDADLETKAIDSGLVNLSPDERRKYLEQLAAAFSLKHWRMNRNALAELVRSGSLEAATMDLIAARAAEHFERTLTTEFLFRTMQQSDETVTLTLDSLEAAFAETFRARLAEAVGTPAAAVLEQFEAALERVHRDQRITEVLSSDEFSIRLNLPGTIIESNGLLSPEEPGTVRWSFEGKKLHDADLPLYALSVVAR
ncbi:MAG TPA: hypothetical protein PKM94_04650, partial [candidate division Zixibacteria bacterium]|nr:hypothetical protein [candidate division Zixibacteria bacterium]